MVTRGAAGLLCLFTLSNLIARCSSVGRDVTIWWVDLRSLPPVAAAGVELAAVVAFGLLAAKPRLSPTQRRVLAGTFVVLAVLAAADVASFIRLAGAGWVRPTVMLPWSTVVAVALAWFAVKAVRPLTEPAMVAAAGRRAARVRRLRFAAGFAAAAVALPLAQMAFFGTTDYRRPADAAVVLGAGVYADGSPSLALADRVTTACQLYREGRVRLLVMSGGPGPGGVHETDVMRRLALAHGVPDAAILLDRDGLTTEATARNATALLDDRGVRRVLAVSHAYHLPRVKLAFGQVGREVYTVPAEETRRLAGLPKFVAREVAALWVYYARDLFAA